MGIPQRRLRGLWTPHSNSGDFTSPRVQTMLSGLDFAGNTSYPSVTPNTPILVWNNSPLGGTAPLAVYPATYIWRAYPRANGNAYGSFWTFLFHARWQTTEFDQSAQRYYGMHPYPDPGDSGINKWEISSHGGDNFVDDVVFDRWYQQVATVELVSGDEVYTYYWNWPNTTTDKVVTSQTQASANTNPALIIGDAPWNRGKEAPNAILRGYQFYDAVLSPTDIAAEIASPGSTRTPWYLNLNPTPSDVSDKSGSGNHPAWYDSNRPALWTEAPPPPTGLDFAGNTSYPSATPNTPILAWNSTVLGGTAPFAIYPATYIWRSYPRENFNFSQIYWTYIFYVRYETTWTQGEAPAHSYYGFHPWPDRETDMEHKWEIAGFGDDRTATLGGAQGVPIDYDRWHQHVATVELVGANEVYTFYFDWPDTTNKVIQWTHAQALTMVGDPAIIIGDAPWNRGREAPNAILRGFQFYDAKLSTADIAAEIAAPGSTRSPWYLNLNPTPTDVTDKSGNGHHPTWVDSNRPTLWTG